MNFFQGEIIAIDKPLGITSFGALAHIRYLLTRRMGGTKVKVGHAGTLDPLATGVLILCTGRATKQIESLQAHTKEYVATLQLGATTASYDCEHEENASFPTAHITREAVLKAIDGFVGDIEQVPPSYSACKIDGERAYTLRRSGENVTLKPKRIRIDAIELIDFDTATMRLTIRVVCGKGTYIRALARDLGRALDSGAYLVSLRRTRVGAIRVEDCIDYDRFDEWLDKQEIEREHNI
ncbi:MULTISPECIES: tRNA pseudouridine(55) synthase TruB [Prevotellaceae]|uniref:tRNA pseudouridine(55) synthase TruB n=1 Tax=Prevotellaceae TaxID=171552 RepID=UPI0003D2AA80|nr:tRNA pseudouridine(55) synthase TruB [Prevotella phocaeensis]ETD16042.1 tRNA pseudouridine(55) synthase [Hoylesella oralis CC98A]